ncbi:MAG: hypothetical protein L0387_43820 [Acidobacteria bacterium]|nr:hypothetical protein [Acidobacteriota bacterium]
MQPEGRLRQHRRERRPYPYYKVQVFSEAFQTWRDERTAFGSIEAAQKHIATRIPDQLARIIVVERKRRYPLSV